MYLILLVKEQSPNVYSSAACRWILRILLWARQMSFKTSILIPSCTKMAEIMKVSALTLRHSWKEAKLERNDHELTLDCYLPQALSSILFAAFIPVYHLRILFHNNRTRFTRRRMPTRKTQKLCCYLSPHIGLHGVWLVGAYRNSLVMLMCLTAKMNKI